VIDDPTSAIRYVYQPLEDLWLVILTNRQSNILQDIDTLQLFSRIVSDFCRGTVTEAEVLGRSFEVLSSFDEVVSMGYREKIDLNGIRSVMEMESHEEKIQEIIAKVTILSPLLKNKKKPLLFFYIRLIFQSLQNPFTEQRARSQGGVETQGQATRLAATRGSQTWPIGCLFDRNGIPLNSFSHLLPPAC
jgi:hypothetical protein